MKTQKKYPFIILAAIAFAIALTGFIVGSFYDKSVSESIFKKYEVNIPWFSVIFTCIGPLVTNCFGAFAGTALFITTKRKSKFMNVLLKAFGILGLLAISFFTYTSGSEYAEVIWDASDSTRTLLKIILLIVIICVDALIIFITIKNIKKLDPYKTFWVSLAILLLIGGIALSGEVIKYLASRPRPRLVFAGGQAYREWYQWVPFYGFKENESKSFVSGHSLNAMTLITIIPMFISLTKVRDKKHILILSSVVGVLYAFVVGLSRLLGYAHYMTDICGGYIVSLILQSIILFVLYLIRKKVDIYQPN